MISAASRRRAVRRPAPARARRSTRDVEGQHPRHRDRLGGAARRIFRRASLRARRRSSCRRARARISGCRRTASISAARPAMMPACGPPSSLSPLNRTSVGARGDAARGAGSSPQRWPAAAARRSSRCRVFDHRQVEAVRRAPTRSARARPLGEALDAEVRRVHAEDRRGALADGRGVVRGAGAVGGADFAQDARRTAP